MARIVLMEDDAATRTLVSSVLQGDGHEVHAAADGSLGLRLVTQHRPDIVISDVHMPLVGGLDMLAALRQDPVVATTPVILLTTLDERMHMRMGMAGGADDYLTKPFRPGELRQAIAAQLNKRELRASAQAGAVQSAVTTALTGQRNTLARLYEQRLAHELSQRWPAAGANGDEHFASATVLFVDIPRYAEVAQKLQPEELTELVKRVYSSANDTAHLFGARHMQFVGEGLLAVFTDGDDTHTVNHALRATRTALGLAESAHGLRKYLELAYADRGLPAFSLNVALNTGPVMLTQLVDPLHGSAQRLPVGEAVSTTLQLQQQARALAWPIAAAASTFGMVDGAVRSGRRAQLTMPGRAQALEAFEVCGLAARGA